MCFGERDGFFDEQSLLKLLRTLLGVEADGVKVRRLSRADFTAGCREIRLGLGHPFKRERLHTG